MESRVTDELKMGELLLISLLSVAMIRRFYENQKFLIFPGYGQRAYLSHIYCLQVYSYNRINAAGKQVKSEGKSYENYETDPGL